MRRLDVRLGAKARGDLEDLQDRIEFSGGDRDVGRRYRERLLLACLKIGDAPEGGRLRSDIGPGLRMWVFERRMIILYRIEARAVRILRIVDGRREYGRLFSRNRSER
jgi:toxin ParE1/3/4